MFSRWLADGSRTESSLQELGDGLGGTNDHYGCNSSAAPATSDSFGQGARGATDRIEIAEIVKLPVFERFAFVMSVLEDYSDHECSLHLGCMRAAVAEARVRALERIGRATAPHYGDGSVPATGNLQRL